MPSPFEDDEPPWPFRRLPTIGDTPENIRPDVAHTYAIVGWGKDLAASSLLLLVRLKVFTARSVQAALDLAYESFCEYVHRMNNLSDPMQTLSHIPYDNYTLARNPNTPKDISFTKPAG